MDCREYYLEYNIVFYCVIVYLSDNTPKGNELNAFLVSDQAGWLQLIFKEDDAPDVWQLGREKTQIGFTMCTL